MALDAVRNLFVGIGRHRLAAAAPVVLYIDERHRLRPVVYRPRQHQQGKLVDSRHRLELRRRQILARLDQLAALHVRLGIRRVVVASQREIIKGFRPRQPDHRAARGEILVAAGHPVLHGLLGNQPRQKLVFLFLPARQPFRFLLVRQRRIAENIASVARVVARLLAARRLRRARRPHDGTPDVQLHLRVRFLEGTEPRHPLPDLRLLVVMLARAYKAAVEQGIRRKHRDVRVFRIVLQPVPNLFGISEHAPAA